MHLNTIKLNSFKLNNGFINSFNGNLSSKRLKTIEFFEHPDIVLETETNLDSEKMKSDINLLKDNFLEISNCSLID